MKIYSGIFIFLLFLSCKPNQTVIDPKLSAQQDFTSFIEEFTRHKGFFDIYWDNKSGNLWLNIDKLDQEFLYVNSLVTGAGSNDIGLDRGQFGDNRVVKFVLSGSKILLVQSNYNYRADTDNAAEKNAVEEAFAVSVLWGFSIHKSSPEGFLVNATDFFMQDIHDVAGTLKSRGQGIYSVDRSKSALLGKNIKNFPQNTEIEAILTFSGNPMGDYIRQVAPSPKHISFRERHSFIQLPEKEFEMRPFDPRAGYSHISYNDYASPIDQPIKKRFIIRHRLQKKDPEAEISEPVEPIVYYLDPAAPEPVRSALLEGGRWWNEAFEAAGYRDAFKIEMLPENADIMDIRYNVIQWVHRATRGWSYGRSVIDPRTGEIIKGHVTLGSLRVRQDFLIAQGLLSPYYDDETEVDKAREMALARIRQLSAHEIGHTLGLTHNFASSVNDRASVMDYPHPLIQLNTEGDIVLSQAYDTGIGEWDKTAIRYGYTDTRGYENKKEVLEEIIEESIRDGLHFISDTDARPPGSAHPYAHLWDNNMNAADELNRIIEIRKYAISNFGIYSIPEGMPLSSLENVLVPVYLLHRYQAEAASKLIGGLYYSYALRGDGQVITSLVPPEIQRMAVDALLETITPSFLKIPENILSLIPPKALGYNDERENFNKKTGMTFDPLSTAETAADMTIRLMLNPKRVSRLIEHHARHRGQPDLNEILDLLISNTWEQSPQDPYEAEINRIVSKLVLSHLIKLAINEKATGQARAKALAKIFELEDWLKANISNADGDQKEHYLYGIERIRKFKKDPDSLEPGTAEDLPPGSPIGSSPLICDF